MGPEATMPIKVKDPSASATKYTNNTANAVGAYKAGVQSPKTSQSAAAIAAVGNWQAAVTSSNARNAFVSGLTKAGDTAWLNGALNKGADRYPVGTRLAAPKWQANVTPFLQAIAGFSLPPKGIRGAAQNWQRSQALGLALHQLKIQRQGGTGS
jgi:hypothetical protein